MSRPSTTYIVSAITSAVIAARASSEMPSSGVIPGTASTCRYLVTRMTLGHSSGHRKSSICWSWHNEFLWPGILRSCCCGRSSPPCGRAASAAPRRRSAIPSPRSASSCASSRTLSAVRCCTGHCGVGLLEDLAASQLPQALADLARLHPGATLEVLIVPEAAMREAYDTGRVQLVLDEVRYLPGPPRWTVRRPLVWAVGQGVDIAADPLPVVAFSGTCTWRTSVLEALERADRRWRVAFESNSLAGVLAGLRTGLGVAA